MTETTRSRKRPGKSRVPAAGSGSARRLQSQGRTADRKTLPREEIRFDEDGLEEILLDDEWPEEPREELKEQTRPEKERIQTEKKQPEPEKEQIQAEEKQPEPEKEQIQAEEKQTRPEKERIQAEKKQPEPEKEQIQAEKKQPQPEKEQIQAEEKQTRSEKERIQTEKKQPQPEKELVQTEKEQTRTEKERFEEEAPAGRKDGAELAGKRSEEKDGGVRTDIKSTGKFGLGHKKTKRAAILYILEDIGEGLVRAKNWCVKNYRTSIPGAICLVLLIAVGCVLVRNARIQRENDRAQQLQADIPEDSGIPVQPLEENAYEYVNQFVEKYFTASAEGDVDTYVSMRSFTDETERIRMQKKADYIEYYQNINCYTKPGPVENSFLVYVYYEAKFNGIDTAAPGLKTLYLCTNDAGELYVFSGEVDKNVTAYMQAVSTQEDVKDLFTKAEVTYNDIVDSDEELKTFLEQLSDNLKHDVTLAFEEAEKPDEGENTEPEQPEPTPEVTPEPEQPEPQTDTVVTTDRVNVRSSASTEATKLGTVAAGTQLTRYESMENGWSRVEYEGADAYIKTEYLQVAEASVGTVTTTDRVNIRASASTEATKLGTVAAGTVLELLERQENGWTRILYNGSTAYVKSDYVE